MILKYIKVRLVITSLLSSIIYSTPAVSAPIPTLPFVIEQPDGEQFMARRWGDEFQSGYEDSDGYSIALNEESGYWYYTTNNEDDKLITTSLRADKEISTVTKFQEKNGETIEVKAFKKHARIEKKNQEKINTERQKFNKGLALSKISPSGTFNLPVVIVNFADATAARNTPTNLASLVRNMDTYFNEVSFGQFRVSAGPNGIMSVTVPRNKSHYATDTFVTIPPTPENPSSFRVTASDTNMKDLFTHVVAQLNLNNVDLSKYDNDNDGAVDELMLVAAGSDSASSNPLSRIQYNNRFHSANAPRGLYGSLPRGAKRIDNILWVSEYMHASTTGVGQHPTTIGVAVHELLHTFGAPDLYDFLGSRKRNDAGIGNWGVMASGNWLPLRGLANDGSRPVHPSAFIKKKLGWVPLLEKSRMGMDKQIKQYSYCFQLFLGDFQAQLMNALQLSLARNIS